MKENDVIGWNFVSSHYGSKVLIIKVNATLGNWWLGLRVKK